MNNINRGFVGIAIGIVLALLMGAGAYALYDAKPAPSATSTPITLPQADSQLPQQIQTNPQPASTSQPVVMSGIYTNARLGFKVKVLDEWEIIEHNNLVTFTPKGKANDAPTGGAIKVEENVSSTTLAVLMEKAKSVPYHYEFKKVTIGGEPAFSYRTGEFAGTLAVVLHNNKIYTLDNEMLTRPEIFSTFAFISTSIGSVNASTGVCGLIVDSPSVNAKVTFPLTITGRVDNTNAATLGCAWGKFEGEAGSVQLYHNYGNKGWKPVGAATPVQLAGDWMSPKTTFKVTVSFNNGGMGLPAGTPMKLVFTEANAKDGEVDDTFELPVVFKNSLVDQGI